MYLTFRPAKGNTTTLKLVKCLSILIDTVLLLLMAWAIVNVCYPFWGWAMYVSIWVGFIPYVFFTWLIKRFDIRSFVTAKFRPTDRLMSNGLHNLKHLGFLFSVWETPDSLILGYYHRYDQLYCLRKRTVCLGDQRKYKKWLGWLIALSTDAVPVVLLAALLCAAIFLGIGSVIFFLMGIILAGQLRTICDRFLAPYLWTDRMFLDGKMCHLKFRSMLMCVLEGPEGETILTLHAVAIFNRFTKAAWFSIAASPSCRCCYSMRDPVWSKMECW